MTMIEDDIGIEMQCDILLILAKLCEYDPQRWVNITLSSFGFIV